MFFQQIKYMGDNFSYFIADEKIKAAIVIDPSFNSQKILNIAEENKFEIKYVFNTHHHRDHTAGNKEIKRKYNSKIVAHRLSPIEKDVMVQDNDEIRVGEIKVKVLHTPGHTSDGICLLIDDKVFTGDTLFVGECGRTDLPGSDTKDMYYSLFEKLMNLKDNILVYPGHDYGYKPFSTIGIERKTNYVLKKRSLEEFIMFMNS